MRTCSRILLAACLLALPLAIWGADWPQWRGPDRTGLSKETGLLKEWPKEGPPLVWTFDNAGTGFAGPAIVGGRLYTMGARGDVEYVIALDGKGQELWSKKIGPLFFFKGNSWSGGPNATPTVDGTLLYALGSQGDLVCLETADGKEVWRKNLPKELAAEISNVFGGKDTEKMGWGFCWSPLVDGDHLVCIPGGPEGLFASLNKKTGALEWRSKAVKDQATYSSPIAIDVGGVRQYVAMVQNGVIGVAAKNGDLLWEYRREDPYPDVVCPTPISLGDQVYVTTIGACELLKLTPNESKWKVEAVYSEKEIANPHGGVVLVDKYVYGYNGTRAWGCQDFATGEMKWESGRDGLKAGALVYADGQLYCLDERGMVGLLKASPQKYQEINRFPLPKQSTMRKPRGGVWTPPVIADGHLYLRDQELIFCYKIK
jgi:outer membrane protein assembly factor BamB